MVSLSRPGRDEASGDLVADYLDRLRARLRCAPREAKLIVAEAEDHLRETMAAGMAIGMTAREAQEAAISSFGPVQAVTRAHQARLIRGAGLVDVVMAAWKLIALLLLVGGVGAMVNQLVDPPWPIGEGFMGPGTRAGSGSWQFGPDHLAFNWTNGTWHSAVNGAWTHLGVIHHLWSGGTRGTLPFLDWHTVTLLTAAGAILLAGYSLARRGQRHRGAPLAGFFPVVAVGFFGVIAIALLGLRLSSLRPTYDPFFVMDAFGVLLGGYAARTGQTLLRRR